MPRFTTRDLMLLVMIVALAIAWGLDHWRLVVTQERLDTLVAELVSLDFEVEFENGLWVTPPVGCSGRDAKP